MTWDLLYSIFRVALIFGLGMFAGMLLMAMLFVSRSDENG